ncbi:MAG: hypothetical protein AAF585_09600, partial [Verrucomicrobiota bacterium]
MRFSLAFVLTFLPAICFAEDKADEDFFIPARDDRYFRPPGTVWKMACSVLHNATDFFEYLRRARDCERKGGGPCASASDKKSEMAYSCEKGCINLKKLLDGEIADSPSQRRHHQLIDEAMLMSALAYANYPHKGKKDKSARLVCEARQALEKGWDLLECAMLQDQHPQKIGKLIGPKLFYDVWIEKNPEPNQPRRAVIAIRGSTTSGDWLISNTRFFWKSVLPWYDQYDRVHCRKDAIIKRIKDLAAPTYPNTDFEFITTGHSLAGGLAQMLMSCSEDVTSTITFDTSPINGRGDLDADEFEEE